MRCKIYLLVGYYLLSFSSLYAYDISAKKIRKHVEYLSSNALEGRLTGSFGEKLATAYIAELFSNLELEPAGDNGTFYQSFDFISGVMLGTHNSLIIHQKAGNKTFVINKNWRPLSYSNNALFKNEMVVFAGYGITAPARQNSIAYDSYQGLDVKNKWVVVSSALPKTISQDVKPYSSVRYRVFTAKEHGAKGIIFSGNQLLPLSFDTSLTSVGIGVLSIKQTHSIDWQDVAISGQTEMIAIKKKGRNVLGKLSLSNHPTSTIIVGAHVDHLGRGTLGGSRARDKEYYMIHPGADDNASGVASMLESAAKLSLLKREGMLHGNKDIIFAAWSGEEFGVLGSSYFINHYPLSPRLNAVLNLDMVGHLKNYLVLQGTGSSSDWSSLIKPIKKHHPIAVIMQTDPYLPTDTTPFYLKGIPVLNFFTGAHDDYHTPRDKANTLNYLGIERITNFLVDVVVALSNKPLLMSYHDVGQKKDNSEQGLNVYLGTIPDYASSTVSGVKLSGVAKQSPASQAGLRQGDIIVKLADKTIHDIYDYTFALHLLTVGKKANITIIRDSKKVVLVVVARYRGAI